MDKLDIRVSDLRDIPTRAHPTDAGLDLKAKDCHFIGLHERVLIKTGVYVRIPKGYVGMLVPRSSLSKKNLILSNSVGIIDSDYRGELLVSLTFIGSRDRDCFGVDIEEGERIAQLLIVPIVLPEVNVVLEDIGEWNSTTRGTGGFGSTGK